MWSAFFRRTKKSKKSNISKEFDSGVVRSVVVSDLGNIRTNNEDVGLFFRIADDSISAEKGCLLMVADGMGGHQAGEVASNMAAQIISHEYYKQQGSIEKSLEKAFELANKKIFELASGSKAHRGMGTTCTALVIFDKEIYYAHAGDSRAYILKRNHISRITEDHTHVSELVKNGSISAAEAEKHPDRNILTNAMGTKPVLRVDTGKFHLSFEENDRLLLCSDGLYDYIRDNEMGELLSEGSLSDVANRMVALAKQRGGHDNITVVLAERVHAFKDVVSKETRDFAIPATKEFDLS
jgi:PPM family protein phosphatase